MTESYADVPADDSPVPAGPATLPIGARPLQAGDRLVLRVPIACGLSVLIFPAMVVAVAAIAIFYVELQGRAQPQDVAFVLLVPAVGMVVACWFACRRYVLPRVTFDKTSEMLTLGWKGLRGRRSLSSILGVQVMQTRKRFGGPELNIPAMTLYQVNLILDDPAEQRLNVMTCDRLTARSTARTVADFLNVSVLDSAGGSVGAAAADAQAEAAILLASFPEILSPVVVLEPGSDVLLIRTHWWAGPWVRQWKLLAPALVLLGLVLVARGGAADWSDLPLVIPLAALALFLPLSLLQMRRARFDRARGEWTVGTVVRPSAPRPLESVKAIEVAEGPENRLILLLDDPGRPRLNLIADADAAVVRRAAERVASFIGAPLQRAGRPAPPVVNAPGSPGKPVNPLELLSRSPLPPGPATIRGPARVVRKGDDVLLLKRRSEFGWARLTLALIFAGLDLYLVWFLCFGPAGQAGRDWAAAIVLLVLVGGKVAALKPLLWRRDRFDRKAGLLKLGAFGLKGAHPLAKILAVQLIPAGLVDRPAGAFGRGGERVSYQLNLVMADAYQDRLNLTDDSDLKWTRQAGREIADFLGTPLLDQIAEDE
jgi:hypothetical protein